MSPYVPVGRPVEPTRRIHERLWLRRFAPVAWALGSVVATVAWRANAPAASLLSTAAVGLGFAFLLGAALLAP